MARVSKYEMMIGKRVNEVLVSGYRRTRMTSKKSGKHYFKYEVELEEVLWVSTTSFNKGSYMKRLAKAMKGKEVRHEVVVSRFNREEDNHSEATFKLTREMLKGNVYNVSGEIYEQALTTLFDVAYYRDGNGELQSSVAFAEGLNVDLNELELTSIIGDKMMEQVINLYKADREEGINWLRKFKAYSPKKVMNLKALFIDEPSKKPTEYELRNPHIRVANMILFYEALPLLKQWLDDNWSVYEVRWEQFEQEFEELVRHSGSVVENEFSKYFTNCKTKQEVKKQYRALAKQYHSDLVGGDDSVMSMINVAYEQALQMIA